MRSINSIALLASSSILLCSSSASADTLSRHITLQSGHSIVIAEPGLTRVAVGDGQIAGVLPIGTQQVVINGKTIGRTTVFVWNKHGRTAYEVEVNAQDVVDLVDVIRESVDQEGVTITMTGHTIVALGQVENSEKYAQLIATFSQFTDAAKEQKMTLINAVTVLHPLGALSDELHRIPGTDSIRVDPDNKGNVVVSGFVDDRVTAERILGHVRGLAAPYLSVDGKVVDRIETAVTAQIDIKVNVLEVDETAQRQLGDDLQSAVLDPATGVYTYGSAIFPLVEGSTGGLAQSGATVNRSFLRQVLLAPTLQALVTDGHARSLSSPDLTTLPGTEADFLVGGQIPYVTVSGVGAASVQFQNYGVELKVTPSILANGSIQAVIAPEISELDEANAVIQNGFSIPALTTSKLSTTAVTRPGQSIVLGGMMRHLESRTISRWPILGNLPILGKLFSSTNYQSNKSDVVFVLTPTIINR